MGKGARQKRRRTESSLAAEQRVQLANPVADHYATWIYGNSTMCERVVEPGSGKGQHLVLCGAGPSLAEHAAEWCPQGDQVWGCNSALIYLLDKGHKVTHGFCIDQTPEMLEEWASAPDVEYLLASTVHPHLTEYLLSRGRRLTFFHNYVGVRRAPVRWNGQIVEYEDWLYLSLFPATLRAGSGLNSVTRALDVANVMEFDRVTVLGADCALRADKPCPRDAPVGSPKHAQWLRDHVVMHADGGHALTSNSTPMTFSGEIDGRLWVTKPDMAITAVWIREMAKRDPRIRLIGDTLPNAIMDKPESFIRRLPSLVDRDGKPIPVCLEPAA